MRLSRAKLAIQKIPVFALAAALLLVGFQNCSPGFKLDQSGGSSLANTDLAPGETSGEQKIGSQSAVVVNRNYIVSVFHDIFSLPNGQVRPDVKVEVDKWIFLQSSQFGGGCDVNSTASGQDCGAVIPQYHGGTFLGNKISENLSTIPIHLSVSTIRQSYMLKACENISSLNPAMDYLRAKLGVPNNSEISDQIISDIYVLYFRDDPPSPAMLTIIRDLNSDLKNQNESLDLRWRAVHSFICELPGWQSP